MRREFQVDALVFAKVEEFGASFRRDASTPEGTGGGDPSEREPVRGRRDHTGGSGTQGGIHS